MEKYAEIVIRITLKRKTSSGLESHISVNGQAKCGGVEEALKNLILGEKLITILARVTWKWMITNLLKIAQVKLCLKRLDEDDERKSDIHLKIVLKILT